MRIAAVIIILSVFLFSCKKDKYTSAPQIVYKAFIDNVISQSNNAAPKLIISITDAEGDLGFKAGKDTAFVYLTDKLQNTFDSIPFPDLQSAGTKNFKADVEISFANRRIPHICTAPSPVTDTIYYEIYVKDFAKNKSNVITSGDPLYYQCF